MTTPQTEPFALFDDATWPRRAALLAVDPVESIEAWSADEVPDALARIEEAAARGLIAAGYCAYELGYVFEPRLRPLMPASGRPLLRFHLFRRAQRLNAFARQRWLFERRSGPAITAEVTPTLDAGQHHAKVERVRQLIGDGDVYQVNLTFKLKARAEGDAFATYAALRAKARAGACSFLRFADEDVLSFSPELFFRTDAKQISARPMKGTIARAPDIAGDEAQKQTLLNDEKERAENLMIVDLLRNDLARVSTAGSVKVTDLFTVETYPRFHTLTSGVSGALSPGNGFTRIVPSLFPCGSVTGAPKIRAMEIIREVEDEPRGVYCGAVGFVTRDRMAFNVAIRTLVLRGGEIEMGVGGGIVWDSKPAAEYAEALLKARFLTEREETFRLIETMRWTRGDGVYLLDRHMARLQASARYVGFAFDEAEVRQAIEAATARADGEHARLRLTLGGRGDAQVEVDALQPTAPETVWRYAIATTAVTSDDWRLYHKTTLREVYERELAVQRAATGCDEVVFVNERGEIAEGSRTNIFLERDGVWLTPPVSSGLLDGCLRRELIERGPPRVVEHVLTPDDLRRGTVWFGNALRGLIRGIDVTAARDERPQMAANG